MITRKVVVAVLTALAAVFFFLGILASKARAQVPGFTAAEVQTLGDLNFIARAKVNHTGPVKDRLYAMALALKGQNGGIVAWKQSDPDPGQALGYMADTDPDGHDPYNRSLIDRLASFLGVSVKAVIWPATPSSPPPGPVVVLPPPAPTAPAPGTVDAAIQALVDSKLAGLQAQVSGLAARLAVLEAAAGSGSGTTSSSSLPSIVDNGNGYLTFIARDNGGRRQGDIRGDFQLQWGINNYDAGARALQNWKADGTPCYMNALPAATFGMDSRGAFSYNGNPCPVGTWSADQTYGQAFVIDGGWSQAGYDYATGAQYKPGILLASQRGGMDMLFAVTPWRRAPIPGVRDGDPVLNKTVMRLRSDGSANPVDIVLEGQLRTLRGCTINGVQAVCY